MPIFCGTPSANLAAEQSIGSRKFSNQDIVVVVVALGKNWRIKPQRDGSWCFYESGTSALLLFALPSRAGIEFYDFLQGNIRSLLFKLKAVFVRL